MSKKTNSPNKPPQRRPCIRTFWKPENDVTLFSGDCLKLLKNIPDNSIDCVITSPPYCIGKKYENKREASDFVSNHEIILPEIARIVKEGGSICWQVGYHVKNNVLTPLDFIVYNILSSIKGISLRNRIIWTFGHGLHYEARFSGRHETILWFTKGVEYTFNLDEVRVPQLYPGKKAYKGLKKGKPSGNPLGKNPSDVWHIPNVKANHIEKCDHPCQFPIGLSQRLIKATTNEGDLVFDPYCGTGSTGAAAIILKRRFIGAEVEPKYVNIAKKRLNSAIRGDLKVRPDDKPVYTPPTNSYLTKIPKEWIKNAKSKKK